MRDTTGSPSRDRTRSWVPTTDGCTWRAAATPPRRTQSPTARSLPLAGVRVADFTAFWAGPMATQVLAALGADVIKVEGVRRPDGMRFAGGRPPSWDRWWEWGPVFLCSNTNKRGITLELSTPRGRQAGARPHRAQRPRHRELLAAGAWRNFDLEWDAVHAANPTVTMVRMPAFGLDGPWRDRVGFAQTMEQASGMAWMTGAADGPPLIPRGVCDPLAGLHAGVRSHCGTGDPRPHRNRHARRVDHGGGGAERRGRAGSRISPETESNCAATETVGPVPARRACTACGGDDEWVALAILDDDRRGLALAE